jgi:hypothetical protein
MSNANVMGGSEARKSLIRVWLAVSATWVAFWLLIATTAFAASAGTPLVNDLGIFSLIILTPPLALLGLGASTRFLFETFSRRRRG